MNHLNLSVAAWALMILASLSTKKPRYRRCGLARRGQKLRDAQSSAHSYASCDCLPRRRNARRVCPRWGCCDWRGQAFEVRPSPPGPVVVVIQAESEGTPGKLSIDLAAGGGVCSQLRPLPAQAPEAVAPCRALSEASVASRVPPSVSHSAACKCSKVHVSGARVQHCPWILRGAGPH